MQNRWTVGFWGVVAGIAIAAIVGFSTGWVTTASSAKKMADDQTKAGIVTALVPVCMAQARGDAAKFAEFAALTNASERLKFATDAGWGTAPTIVVTEGQKPNADLVKACVAELTKAAS